MASTGWSCTSSPKVFLPGTSACVRTARTPGAAVTAAISIDTMRAWGCGLRSVAPCSIPSRRRSLAYSNSPLTLGTPSTRRTDSPTPRLRRMSMLTGLHPPRPSPTRGEGIRPSVRQIDELSIPYHGLALDEQMSHRPWVAEHERGNRVGLGAAMCQVIDGEERDVGALAHLD